MSKQRKKRVNISVKRKLINRSPMSTLVGVQKPISLIEAEDSNNLEEITALIALATSSAHNNSLKESDEIIEIRDGKLIHQIRGEKDKVLEKLNYRTVSKGDVFIIEREEFNV